MDSRPQIVQKFSVVYIAHGDNTEVYRSVEEIPTELRRKLIRIARTSHVDTLVIANEKGRELLQSEGWKKPEPPPPAPPFLSPALRWAVILLLAGAVTIVVNWALHFR